MNYKKLPNSRTWMWNQIQKIYNNEKEIITVVNDVWNIKSEGIELCTLSGSAVYLNLYLEEGETDTYPLSWEDIPEHILIEDV